MRRSLVTMSVLGLLACGGRSQRVTSAHPAPPGSWQVLATAVVDLDRERDEFRVTGADSFRRLRVHAVDAGIDMRDMDVIYENGGHEDIQVRSTIQRGESTRPLDLQGGSRRLERVEFSYRSLPNMRGRKAKMVLEGQK
jgi:hypothetical protein